MEGFAQEGKIVRDPSPEQQIPQKMGRPRNNQGIMEALISEEQHIILIVEELLRCAIQLEPVGGWSHKDRIRTRREDITGENDQVPTQQLKQAKLAIIELYQENMELRGQLATKSME
jgi:hypothetical protein